MRFLRVETHEESRTDKRREALQLQEIECIKDVEGAVSSPYKTAVISKSGCTYYCEMEFTTLLHLLWEKDSSDTEKELRHLIFHKG